MPSTFSQAFPPAPTFTEKNVGSLNGKVRTRFRSMKARIETTTQVFIVSGSTSGVGYELSKLLHGQGGDVYIAARSSKKVNRAIEDIASSAPASKGRLSPLLLDLSDLSTIKKAVDDFLRKENRLDVLVHNAGLMTPPAGSKSKLVCSLNNEVRPFGELT